MGGEEEEEESARKTAQRLIGQRHEEYSEAQAHLRSGGSTVAPKNMAESWGPGKSLGESLCFPLLQAIRSIPGNEWRVFLLCLLCRSLGGSR